MDGQHGQIVALLGIAHKCVDCLGDCSQDLLRLLAVACSKNSFHALQSKQLPLCVHRLGQSVGIEEEGGAGHDSGLLDNILHIVEHANGQVGIAWETED